MALIRELLLSKVKAYAVGEPSAALNLPLKILVECICLNFLLDLNSKTISKSKTGLKKPWKR